MHGETAVCRRGFFSNVIILVFLTDANRGEYTFYDTGGVGFSCVHSSN